MELNNKMAGEVYRWQSRFFSSVAELFGRFDVEARARLRNPGNDRDRQDSTTGKPLRLQTYLQS
jgi:hypothetical protein